MEVLSITATQDPCMAIHQANQLSLGQFPPPSKEFNREWIRCQIKAEHSTLELAHITVVAKARGDVISHLVRATKGHPRFVVQSSRPDWTGLPRPPVETTRLLMIHATPYSLIQLARQRLCNKSAPYTVAAVLDLKLAMIQSPDPFISVLGEMLVPDCQYRGGCHQSKPCGKGVKL